MSGADRKKLYRERRRKGIRFVVPISVYEETLDELVAAGEMSEDDADDRAAVGRVVEDLFHHWARNARLKA